eukprot:1527324-Pleurochrysis_carterae.AAC.2
MDQDKKRRLAWSITVGMAGAARCSKDRCARLQQTSNGTDAMGNDSYHSDDSGLGDLSAFADNVFIDTAAGNQASSPDNNVAQASSGVQRSTRPSPSHESSEATADTTLPPFTAREVLLSKRTTSWDWMFLINNASEQHDSITYRFRGKAEASMRWVYEHEVPADLKEQAEAKRAALFALDRQRMVEDEACSQDPTDDQGRMTQIKLRKKRPAAKVIHTPPVACAEKHKRRRTAHKASLPTS